MQIWPHEEMDPRETNIIFMRAILQQHIPSIPFMTSSHVSLIDCFKHINDQSSIIFEVGKKKGQKKGKKKEINSVFHSFKKKKLIFSHLKKSVSNFTNNLTRLEDLYTLASRHSSC